MATFVDLCRFIATLGGTTDWVYSTAVGGCQSPAAANVQAGLLYRVYAVSNDLTQWEISTGINSGGTTFPRTTVLYNSSGTGTAAGQSGAGTKINFSAAPQVSVICIAEDITTSESYSLAASVASGALTVALKNDAGNDPSPAAPVNLWFRSATIGSGAKSLLTITSALSVVISSGSTAGFANATAGRLWLVIFNDAGTPRLGLMNCRSNSQIFPLVENVLQSSAQDGGSQAGATHSNTTLDGLTSTANLFVGMGVAGLDIVAGTTIAGIINSTSLTLSQTAAGTISGTYTFSGNAAGVFYTTGAAVTSKAMRILGHLDWSSGITTAGTWSSGPTTIQIYGPGVKKPGDTVQSAGVSLNEGQTLSATTHTNTVIDGIASTARLQVGMSVTGTNVAANTVIISITSGTAITVNNTTTGSATNNLTFSWVTNNATTSFVDTALSISGFTLTSSPNSVSYSYVASTVSSAASVEAFTTLRRGGVQIAPTVVGAFSTAGVGVAPSSGSGGDFPGSVGPFTYTVGLKSSAATAVSANDTNGGSSLSIAEIMC